MKRTDIQTAGDVLRSILEDSEMGLKIAELKAAEIWQEMIGPDISSQCMLPLVRNGIMTIRVTDAPLRNELHMQRTSMIRSINRTIGKDVIKEIRFKG